MSAEIGTPVVPTDDDDEVHHPKNPDEPFTGYAINKGVLRFTSVTQISMYDKKSDGCPRKWAFRYRFGRKLAKTGALIKGANLGESLFHYLTSGQDLLPPILRPAKGYYPTPGPDLECERKFATGPNGKGKDIEKAIVAREQLVSIGNRFMFKEQVTQLKKDIASYAGLVIHDVPIDGAADFRHRRGNFVDEDGVLRSEVPGFVVIETGDQKVMSRIYAEVIQGGANRGQILPTYAKTSAQVCDDVQMLSYGVYAARKNPDSTHQRLSHVIANKKKRQAVKRTGLISNEQLFERFRRIEDLVLEMEQCAGADVIEDVEPNINACDSYTHVDPTDPLGRRVLQGCGYRYFCPLSKEQVGFENIMGNFKEKGMGTSAFDQLNSASSPPPNGAPSLPAPPPVDYNAQLEAERAKLAAGAAPSWGASSVSFCSNCGQSLTQLNSSVKADGSVSHMGCPAQRIAPTAPPAPSVTNYPPPPATGLHAHPGALGLPGYTPLQLCNGGGFYAAQNGSGGFVVVEPGHKCSVCVPAAISPPPPPVTGAVGVKPPDAPVHDWIDQAKPMPMDQIIAIEDAELKERALLHHKLWFERDAVRQAAAAAAAPTAAPTSVWCPNAVLVDGSQQKIIVTMQMSMDKKYICPCGKSYSMGTLKPIPENGQFVFIVPKHKPVNKAAPAVDAQQSLPAAASPAAPPSLPPAPPLPPVAASLPPSSPPPPAPPLPPSVPPAQAISPPPPPTPSLPAVIAPIVPSLPGEATKMIESMFGIEGVTSAEAQTRRVLDAVNNGAAPLLETSSLPAPPVPLAGTIIDKVTQRIARAIIDALLPIAEGK